MNVYVFGNEYMAEDMRAIEVARDLQNTTVEGVSFVFVNPNEEVPFADEPRVVILDTIQGIQDVALVEGVAVGTIKSRVHRARTQLAALLQMENRHDLGPDRLMQAALHHLKTTAST